MTRRPRRLQNIYAERDVNVYVGPDAYESYLARSAIEPWRHVPGIEWTDVMPRHSLLTLVDRFISNRSHGYLIIEGPAGVAKLHSCCAGS